MNTKFHIITLGCQMNVDDSNNILRKLTSAGYLHTDNVNEADIIIINTCTVRQHAEDKAVSLIGSLKKWKKPHRKLFVIGCAAERVGDYLKKRFEYIDEIVGAKSYDRIDEILSKHIPAVKHHTSFYENKVFDYQTVARGCNMKCSYCIVPYVRGKEVSVNMKTIIEEVEKKAKAGTKEIILLGQTVNSYRDLNSKADFVDLIKRISDIDEIKIIRFLSPHPAFFTEKFYKEYEKNPKISRWIHLPLQSASNKILKLMKRGYNIEKYDRTVKILKEIDPLTSISTDIIVGYPQESEEDFKETLDYIGKTRFSFIYCFKYSPRFNNSQSRPTITKEELEKRHSIILNTSKKIAKEIIDSKKSTLTKALFYTDKEGKTIDGYNCCIIDNMNVNPGDFFDVYVDKIKNNTLYVRRKDDK